MNVVPTYSRVRFLVIIELYFWIKNVGKYRRYSLFKWRFGWYWVAFFEFLFWTRTYWIRNSQIILSFCATVVPLKFTWNSNDKTAAWLDYITTLANVSKNALHNYVRIENCGIFPMAGTMPYWITVTCSCFQTNGSNSFGKHIFKMQSTYR